MSQESALALIFLISGFTMSFAGFGFALVSVPALALFLPIRSAVAIQFPYCLCLFLYQAWHYRADFDWRSMRPLFVGTFAGLLMGTFLLYRLPEGVLKKALAVFIGLVVISTILPSTRSFTERYAHNRWWARFCGFLSGSFLGAYTIGGPPAALYIMSVTRDPRKVKSCLASFFSLQMIPVAVLYAAGGLFSREGLTTTLIYSPAVAVGALLGFWAFGKASNLLYRQVVGAVLLLTAVSLWWRA